MKCRRPFGAAAAILTIATIGGGWAQAAEPPPPRDLADAATLQGDTKLVKDVLQASQTGGFDAIGARLADLRTVLSHAPTPFHRRQELGYAVVIRSTSPAECLEAMLAFAAEKKSASDKARTARCEDNPYPMAAFMIGAYLDDIGQPDAGLAELDLGLGFDPDVPTLVNEKGAALNMLHRPAEALAAYQGGLDNAGPMSNFEKGVALRGKGFALTDLHRYDEAEAAYQESLKVDPDHGHARHELEYIALARKGQAPNCPSKFTSVIAPATRPK